MRKFIYMLTIGLTIVAAEGQTKHAKPILDKMGSTYKAMTGFEISFVQKNFSETQVIDRSSGTTAVSKEKFVLKIEGQHIYCNGPILWTYLTESQELTISNFELEEGDITPANIYDIYKKGFSYEYKREDDINGEKVDVVELISTEKDADFTNIIMYIGQKDAYLKAWEMIDYDGIKTGFEVSVFKPNQTFAPGYFVFDEEANPVQHKEDLRNK